MIMWSHSMDMMVKNLWVVGEVLLRHGFGMVVVSSRWGDMLLSLGLYICAYMPSHGHRHHPRTVG